MRIISGLLASCLVAALAACGDSGSSGNGGAGGAPAGGEAAGGDPSTGGTGGEASAEPQAPVLDELEPIHGALHVRWTNVTPDCDLVHAERKTATVAYAEAFAEPGNVDNKADQGATDVAETYTYRLSCEKDGVMSAYSNELSGTPE